MPLQILLVEDEPALLLTLGEALEDAGHAVTRCASGTHAAARLRDRGFDLLVTDIRLPGVDGCTLAELALAQAPPTPVVLMTAFGQVDQAVEMMKKGARDYLTKPVDERALVRLAQLMEPERAGTDAAADVPIARSPGMAAVLRVARQVAATNTSVLLTGETGAGKEVVARFIHRASRRAQGPFVAASCASIPRDLIESELFGHVRGAYTGAREARTGWIRSADRGTLLLDEAGELSPSAQASLLRALEEHAVLPVGSDHPIPVDFRLLAATNRDLEAETRTGTFRADLFFRLNGFEIRVPPLRERVEDIPPLVRRFLAVLSGAGRPPVVASGAIEALAAYRWPGNVRELRNTVEYACIMAGEGEIRACHLPPRVLARVAPEEPFALRHAIERVEEQHVRRALALAGGARQRAADMLGISRKHLWELTRRYGIQPPGE